MVYEHIHLTQGDECHECQGSDTSVNCIQLFITFGLIG